MTEVEPDSVAGRLAAELEGGGEFVDEGGFDIDANRALGKLAQFQLAEPRAYVLRWAEAGLIAGATQLRFDVDGDVLAASFDREGDPIVIPGAALERLLAVLVSRGPPTQTQLPRELLAQLAVGVVAALGLSPTYLAIESVGRDRGGARMVFGDAGGVESLVDAEPGTRIYLREDLSVGSQLVGATGQRPEHLLLRDHCRYAATPIFLDGRRISQRPLLERPITSTPVVRDGLVIGEAGLSPTADEPARAHLLSHGLLIETLVLHDCQPGFVAVIDVPLPRDLSRSTIARTAELDVAMVPVYDAHRRLVHVGPR